MKDFLIFLPLTVVYLALESTLLPSIPLPDAALLVVFYLAYTKRTLEGAVMGFVLGYIADVFSGGVIGSSSFALVSIFLLVYFLSMKVHFSTPAVRALGAGLLCLAKGLLVYMVLSFASMDLSHFADIFFHSVVTGVFAPAIIVFLGWLSSLVSPQTFEGS